MFFFYVILVKITLSVWQPRNLRERIENPVLVSWKWKVQKPKMVVLRQVGLLMDFIPLNFF